MEVDETFSYRMESKLMAVEMQFDSWVKGK